MLKSTIKAIFKLAGLDIHKVPPANRVDPRVQQDLDMYRELYPEEALINRRFYNVGSGDFYHPFWTNLDFVSNWYSEMQQEIPIVHIDLMKLEPLPIQPNTAEVLYTSHTIEHIKDIAVQNMFDQAFVSLKKGGFFRITTGPDADLDYDALLRKDSFWFYWNKWYEKEGTYEHIFHRPATSVPLEERWLHHVASQLAPNDISPSEVKLDAEKLRIHISQKSKQELLDYLSSLCQFQPERPGNHVSWWNYDKIHDFLRKAGFTKIYKSGYGQSYCPILRNTSYFDKTHPQISVYVEAVK